MFGFWADRKEKRDFICIALVRRAFGDKIFVCSEMHCWRQVCSVTCDFAGGQRQADFSKGPSGSNVHYMNSEFNLRFWPGAEGLSQRRGEAGSRSRANAASWQGWESWSMRSAALAGLVRYKWYCSNSRFGGRRWLAGAVPLFLSRDDKQQPSCLANYTT